MRSSSSRRSLTRPRWPKPRDPLRGGFALPAPPHRERSSCPVRVRELPGSDSVDVAVGLDVQAARWRDGLAPAVLSGDRPGLALPLAATSSTLADHLGPPQASLRDRCSGLHRSFEPALAGDVVSAHRRISNDTVQSTASSIRRPTASPCPGSSGHGCRGPLGCLRQPLRDCR